MLIYPAIDIMDGGCVRLRLGEFDDVTRYGNPLAQIDVYNAAGAQWTHVVDLDGARAGKPMQHDLVGQMARRTGMRLQCGGGVREKAHVAALLEAGVARVVIGSAAVKRPDEVRDWIGAFGPARVCCAFDVRPAGDGFNVATEGWRGEGGLALLDALALYPPGALKHILVTDISRDGVLAGPNVTLMQLLLKARPDLDIQASGGVASLDDLTALRRTGVAGVIVGRALYENRFTLEQALAG